MIYAADSYGSMSKGCKEHKIGVLPIDVRVHVFFWEDEQTSITYFDEEFLRVSHGVSFTLFTHGVLRVTVMLGVSLTLLHDVLMAVHGVLVRLVHGVLQFGVILPHDVVRLVHGALVNLHFLMHLQSLRLVFNSPLFFLYSF